MIVLPRIRQPVRATSLNKRHPLYGMIRFAAIPGVDARNVYTGQPLAQTGTALASTPSRGGLGKAIAASTTNYMGAIGADLGLSWTGPTDARWFYSLAIHDSVSTNARTFALNSNSGTFNQRVGLGQSNGTSNPQYFVRQVNLGTTAVATGASTLVNGNLYGICGVSYGQADHRVFLNGNQDAASTTSLSAGAGTMDSYGIGVDLFLNTPQAAFTGNIILVLAGVGAPSPALIQRYLGLNPWEIFEPEVIYVKAASAATFNPAWARAANQTIVGGQIAA